MINSPTTSDVPKTKIRKRDGRCFEIAYLSLMALPAGTPWRLVHGVANGHPGQRITHAWLSLDGKVWDPVLDKFFGRDEYFARYGAEPVEEFSRSEAATRSLEHNHFGPWSERPLLRLLRLSADAPTGGRVSSP
jgi:hypothetical protein